MRAVLAAINASYSHTPLALHALKAYCADPVAGAISIESFTVNQTDSFILRRLYGHNPHIVGFSCAVWNITQTLRVAANLKKLLPSVLIVFGGPEMSGAYDDYLLNGPADLIIPGEGEIPFNTLLTRYASGLSHEALYQAIPGASWLDGHLVRHNAKSAPLDLCALPFPYPPELDGLEQKIIYYEASRGCPFDCGYCLSSCERGVRMKPLETVFHELRRFIDLRVMRVKFTDRTFNAHADFAKSIWQFLIDHDNGFSNFHFEIAADLLSNEAITLLGSTRPGLFQFEIGVQSVNQTALKAINRRSNLQVLFANTTRIRSYNNIHLHLDLIAGLPGEDMSSFQESFNAVYRLRPHQLQLGFLKILKGTPLHRNAENLGLQYSDYPPYEILRTPWLSYDDILTLKALEEVLEIFYNSGKFTYTLRCLISYFPSPFDLYKSLASFWFGRGYHEAPHGKLRLYAQFRDFCVNFLPEDLTDDLLCFDLLSNENEKTTLPGEPPPPEITRRIRAYRGTQDTRIGYFRYGLLPWSNGETDALEKRNCFIQFKYPKPGRQDILTLHSRIQEIQL